MREIVTERLILRDIVEDDARLLFELDSDPEVMRYIGTRPADDVDWYRERIKRVYRAWLAHAWQGIRMVHDRTSGEFLGWVFARPATQHGLAGEIGWTDPSEIEVGYRYHRRAWGRGFATEAARPLVEMALTDPETSAVVGCALAGNEGSLRVLEKLGLERVAERMLTGLPDRTVMLRRASPGHRA